MSYPNMTQEQKEHRKEYMRKYREENKESCNKLVKESKQRRNKDYKNALKMLAYLIDNYPQVFNEIKGKVDSENSNEDEYYEALEEFIQQKSSRIYERWDCKGI